MHDAIDPPALDAERLPGGVDRTHGIVVHVAVADVAEGAMADARIGRGQRRIGARDEFRNARHGHGHVVGNAAARRHLRLGEALAHLPELGRLCTRRRDLRVAYEALLEGGRQRLAQRLVQGARRALARHVHEHVPGMRLGHRVLVARHALEQEVDDRPADQLEGRDGIAHAALHVAEQRHALLRTVDGDPRRLARRRLREKPQDRRRDDAERAFPADEKLLHVVAGVVLAQAAQAVPDAAVGQYDLEPEDERARVAVAQDLHAARVRRDVAADLAGAFGAEA